MCTGGPGGDSAGGDAAGAAAAAAAAASSGVGNDPANTGPGFGPDYGATFGGSSAASDPGAAMGAGSVSSDSGGFQGFLHSLFNPTPMSAFFSGLTSLAAPPVGLAMGAVSLAQAMGLEGGPATNEGPGTDPGAGGQALFGMPGGLASLGGGGGQGSRGVSAPSMPSWNYQPLADASRYGRAGAGGEHSFFTQGTAVPTGALPAAPAATPRPASLSNVNAFGKTLSPDIINAQRAALGLPTI